MLQHGDPTGTVWRPGEADVSIRPGWFWHAAESATVKSPEELTELFFVSVGRNANLLLNVPPNRAGLLDPIDVSRLTALSTDLAALFAHDAVPGSSVSASSEATGRSAGAVADGDPDTWWSPRADDRSPSARITFRQTARVGVIELAEAIENGQRVARYAVDALVGGSWVTVSEGTTIGHRKLDRVSPVMAEAIRVRIVASRGTPRMSTVAVWPGRV